MDGTLHINSYMTASQNETIQATVKKERGRLLDFIRKRVPQQEDAEDILQDVFQQLVEQYRSMETIEKTTSWLFTVARNKITDLYRKRKTRAVSHTPALRSKLDPEEGPLSLDDILPDFSNNPEDLYLRSVIRETVEDALHELPDAQQQVFVWHEFEDLSFKEMAERTGDSVNTLLSRKRYAILHLRKRLEELFREM